MITPKMAIISEALWNEIDGVSNNIKGYGVLISTAEDLNGAKLKDSVVDNDKVNDYRSENTVPTSYKADRFPEISADSYIWNLRVMVPDVKAKLMTEFVAVAYIVTENNGIIYFDEARASVKSLANEMLTNGGYDEDSFEGSLNYLATLQ